MYISVHDPSFFLLMNRNFAYLRLDSLWFSRTRLGKVRYPVGEMRHESVALETALEYLQIE